MRKTRMARGLLAAGLGLTLAMNFQTAVAADVGMATWYGEDFDGRITADGERFDMFNLTAAHPDLPFGSVVEVTNLANGRKVQVRINDRRAPAPGGLIVLSKAAAVSLGFAQGASAEVELRLAPPAEAATTVARADPAPSEPQTHAPPNCWGWSEDLLGAGCRQSRLTLVAAYDWWDPSL